MKAKELQIGDIYVLPGDSLLDLYKVIDISLYVWSKLTVVEGTHEVEYVNMGLEVEVIKVESKLP